MRGSPCVPRPAPGECHRAGSNAPPVRRPGCDVTPRAAETLFAATVTRFPVISEGLSRRLIAALTRASLPATAFLIAVPGSTRHAPEMFVVSETEADAIRSAFRQGGELSAAIELRRLFPAIPDNDEARDCARAIASWKPSGASRET